MEERRAAFSKAVLNGPRGGIVLTPSLEESYRFVNDYAPEHLEILSREAVHSSRPHHQRRRGADGAAHADHARQLRARAELRAPDERLGKNLWSPLGD